MCKYVHLHSHTHTHTNTHTQIVIHIETAYDTFEQSCYGLSQQVETDISDGYEPFPKSEYMKKFKPKYQPESDHDGKKNIPSPEDCILDMVNKQLQVIVVTICMYLLLIFICMYIYIK